MKSIRFVVTFSLLLPFAVGCQTTLFGEDGNKVVPQNAPAHSALSGTLDGRAWQYSIGIATLADDEGGKHRMYLTFYEGYEFTAEPSAPGICDIRRLKPTDVEILINAPIVVGAYELPSEKVSSGANSFTYRNDIQFAKDLDTGTSGGVGTVFIGNPVTGTLTITSVEEDSITGELIASGGEKGTSNSVSGTFRAFICPKKY